MNWWTVGAFVAGVLVGAYVAAYCIGAYIQEKFKGIRR